MGLRDGCWVMFYFVVLNFVLLIIRILVVGRMSMFFII